MCVNRKTFIVRGEQRTAVCNRCWSCRLVKANDYLGRALAEARMADHCLCVTLTYSDDPSVTAKFNEASPRPPRRKASRRIVSEAFAASSVVKRHVQDFIRSLRKQGMKRTKNSETGETEVTYLWRVRYFHASEFGPLNGRVHHHLALFFYGGHPEMPLNKRLWGGDRFWPHGMTYWQEFTVKRCYYVCKYQLKPQTVDNKLLRNQRGNPQHYQMQQWATRSDQPPLGIEYFRSRAKQIAKQALPLRDLLYWFPDVPRSRGGGRQEFRLRFGSASAEAYIRAYLDEWERLFPGQHPPDTDLLHRYWDRHAAASVTRKTGTVGRVAMPHLQPDGSLRQPGDPLRASFDDKLNTWVATYDGHRLLWSFDIDGNRGWSAHIVSPSEARRRRAQVAGAVKPVTGYRAASMSLTPARAPVLAAADDSSPGRSDEPVERFVAAVERHFGPGAVRADRSRGG